jgi:hypothetical protein
MGKHWIGAQAVFPTRLGRAVVEVFGEDLRADSPYVRLDPQRLHRVAVLATVPCPHIEA